MNRLSVSVAVLAGLAGASVAQADLFSVINSMDASGVRWFNDYPGSALFVINNGLPSVRIQDNFSTGVGFTNRHHVALAANGTAYNFGLGQQAFQLDMDVTIAASSAVRTEAGIWVGTAPAWPTAAGADVGQFVMLPDNGTEIAAFGSALPFFSNNQPGNAGMARALRGVTRHLTLIYNTSPGGSSINYGVDGVFTGNLPFSGLLPNSLIGVYTQGPNGPSLTGTVDVTFSNIAIAVPAPGAAALLGVGGLLALRRRRR